jgi:phage-related protein
LRDIGIGYKLKKLKPVAWTGTSRRDLGAFPEDARRKAGQNLRLVQLGQEPEDWKPMDTVGKGVHEIRVTTRGGSATIQHRVFYVAKFEEAVYVLHAFEKKSQKTSKHDIEIGRTRYRQMLRERRDTADKQDEKGER